MPANTLTGDPADDLVRVVRPDGVVTYVPPPDDYEIAEVAAAPKQQRQRKPSIATLIKRAEKSAGKTVTSVTTADGTTIHFSTPEPSNALDQWLVKKAESNAH